MYLLVYGHRGTFWVFFIFLLHSPACCRCFFVLKPLRIKGIILQNKIFRFRSWVLSNLEHKLKFYANWTSLLYPSPDISGDWCGLV
uniref:Putative secreted protein n=1 Tax=Psorophora albipes TaxID=869069 RepID=T1D5R0_9DIPT